jgi:hypothetical protein
MASIYKREKSGFWWIKFLDPATGDVVRRSTKLTFNSTDTRRARQLAADYTYRESKLAHASPKERWDAWVEAYLTSRCGPDSRYHGAWRNLRMFLTEKEIEAPRQLLRENCLEYLAWRAHADKKNGKYRAGHNTALLELKVLTIIMAEAVLRNWSPFNPCRDLHLKRAAGKQKPELPHTALEKIIAAIELEPEPRRTFFRNSFLIARYHGCRLTETHLNPQDDVRIFEEGEGAKKVLKGSITFHAKGGKLHTVNLHPELFPLFTKLRADGATETYAMPLSPAKDWFNFLNRAGIKRDVIGACFHSLRVTAATTLARKGVSEKKAMSYLGHASTTVHRSYVRLKPDDLSDCAAALV